MPQCDTCQCIYHWKWLDGLVACLRVARQAAENSASWHGRACTDPTQAAKMVVLSTLKISGTRCKAKIIADKKIFVTNTVNSKHLKL